MNCLTGVICFGLLEDFDADLDAGEGPGIADQLEAIGRDLADEPRVL